MISVHLPAAELCQQTTRDATLHHHATAPVLDAFDLSRLVEQRDQGTLLVGKPDVDRCVRFIQFLLNYSQQVLHTGPIQSRDRDCPGEMTHDFTRCLWVT